MLEPHEEQALRNHLDGLTEAELAHMKAHAHAADHEEHASFKALGKLMAAILGVGAISVGMVWKTIKVIKNH